MHCHEHSGLLVAFLITVGVARALPGLCEVCRLLLSLPVATQEVPSVPGAEVCVGGAERWSFCRDRACLRSASSQPHGSWQDVLWTFWCSPDSSVCPLKHFGLPPRPLCAFLHAPGPWGCLAVCHSFSIQLSPLSQGFSRCFLVCSRVIVFLSVCPQSPPFPVIPWCWRFFGFFSPFRRSAELSTHYCHL